MQRLFRLLFAVAVVGWLCIVPVGAASAQSQVTLTVSVVDQGDVAVGDADIEATWDGGETTATTASNGQAFVDVPAGADVSLDVDDEKFVRNEPVVVEDADERDVTVQVALKGNSTVTVTDAEGEPLEDATVEFRRDGGAVVEGETGADGTFETGVIEQGDYRVRAVKPGYFRESTRHDVGIDSEQSFELESGKVRLDVTVVDDHFEEPRTLEDARVNITDAEGGVATVRASGGSASISVGVNTRYTVTIRKDGYVEESRQVTVDEQDRAIQAATQRLPALTVQRQNERVVVGEETRLTVVNAYEEPVEGAEIRYDGEAVGETDANGEVVVTVSAEGEQEFVAVDGDVESDPAVVEGIEPGGNESTDGGPTDTDTQPDLIADGPGFGAVVAILGILGAFLLARRV